MTLSQDLVSRRQNAHPELLALLESVEFGGSNGTERIARAVMTALDEAGTPAGQNVLGLPSVLPKGVYVIASQRPVPVVLHLDPATTPRCLFALDVDSEDNKADMRHFLKAYSAHSQNQLWV